MPKNLGCFIPCSTDATSLYRGVGPLSALRRKHGNLNLCFSDKIDWAVLKLMDGAFIQRPFTADHLKVATMIRRMNLPLWLDYDDLLTDVPEWNPVHGLYSKKQIQENIGELCTMADVISVSTPAIAQELSRYNSKCLVVPNAYDPGVWKKTPPAPRDPDRGLIVLWRGSCTHRVDLNVAANAATNFSGKFEHVTWVFIGDRPWFVDYMPPARTLHYPAIDPLEYAAFLANLAADLLIVPLVDHPFNRAKSNCAWLEATSSNTAVLAPDFPEWNRPGIATYDPCADTDDFSKQLHDILTCPDLLLSEAQLSWEHISKNLMLEHVNETRLKILDSMGLC